MHVTKYSWVHEAAHPGGTSKLLRAAQTEHGAEAAAQPPLIPELFSEVRNQINCLKTWKLQQSCQGRQNRAPFQLPADNRRHFSPIVCLLVLIRAPLGRGPRGGFGGAASEALVWGDPGIRGSFSGHCLVHFLQQLCALESAWWPGPCQQSSACHGFTDSAPPWFIRFGNLPCSRGKELEVGLVSGSQCLAVFTESDK